jgi:hypothetical protein
MIHRRGSSFKERDKHREFIQRVTAAPRKRVSARGRTPILDVEEETGRVTAVTVQESRRGIVSRGARA